MAEQVRCQINANANKKRCDRRRRLSIISAGLSPREVFYIKWRQPNPPVFNPRQKFRGEGRLVRPKYREILSHFCLCCFVINVYIFIAKTRGFHVPNTVVCSFLSRHACTQRSVARRDKNCCEWDYKDRRVWHPRKNQRNKETKKRKKNKRAIACAQGCLRCHVTQRFLHDRQVTNASSSVPQRLLLAAGYSNKNRPFTSLPTTQRGQLGGGERDR